MLSRLAFWGMAVVQDVLKVEERKQQARDAEHEKSRPVLDKRERSPHKAGAAQAQGAPGGDQSDDPDRGGSPPPLSPGGRAKPKAHFDMSAAFGSEASGVRAGYPYGPGTAGAGAGAPCGLGAAGGAAGGSGAGSGGGAAGGSLAGAQTVLFPSVAASGYGSPSVGPAAAGLPMAPHGVAVTALTGPSGTVGAQLPPPPPLPPSRAHLSTALGYPSSGNVTGVMPAASGPVVAPTPVSSAAVLAPSAPPAATEYGGGGFWNPATGYGGSSGGGGNYAQYQFRPPNPAAAATGPGGTYWSGPAPSYPGVSYPAGSYQGGSYPAGSYPGYPGGYAIQAPIGGYATQSFAGGYVGAHTAAAAAGGVAAGSLGAGPSGAGTPGPTAAAVHDDGPPGVNPDGDAAARDTAPASSSSDDSDGGPDDDNDSDSGRPSQGRSKALRRKVMHTLCTE